MEAARRSAELTRSLNSEESSRRRSSLDLDCSQSLRASPQWRAAMTVADVFIPRVALTCIKAFVNSGQSGGFVCHI
jgi:hypothetical protein